MEGTVVSCVENLDFTGEIINTAYKYTKLISNHVNTRGGVGPENFGR
jgi:hypothetical protein